MSDADEFADFKPAPGSAAAGKDEFGDFKPADAQSATSQQPPSTGMLASLRGMDEKYLGGMGRQAVLAARSVPDAAVGLASMPADAITGAVDYTKERMNGRPFSWQDLNPFSQKGGYADPNLPSNQINSTLNQVLPHPENTTEKIAHGVETFLAGAKMPVPGSVGVSTLAGLDAAGSALRGGETAASLAPEARAAAPSQYGVSLAGGAVNPSGLRPGDTQRATDIVKNRLLQDYTPWDTAAQNVKDLNEQGIPWRLANSGPNTRSTAEVLAQKPGGAATTMERDLSGIVADTKPRVANQTRDALAAEGDVGSASDMLSRIRTKNAKENYEAVRQDSTPVLDPEIWKILENPEVAKIYQQAAGSNTRARSMLNTAGVESPPFADIYAPRVKPAGEPQFPNQEPGVIDTSKMREPPEPPRANEPNAPANPADQETEWVRTGQAPDVRSLDNLQQLMNRQISSLYTQAKNGVGGAGNEAEALKMLRGQLKDRLEQVSPAYKKASSSYGDDTEIMEAMERGRKGGADSFFNLSPAQASKYVNGLSEPGQAALRMGVADRLLSAAEMSGRNTNLAADILGGERKSELIRTLFGGDEEKFGLFKQALEKESQVFKDANVQRMGSQTFRRMEAAGDFSDVSKGAETAGKIVSIGSQLHHGWAGAATHGLIKLMQRSTWNPSVASQTAKILSSKDPQSAVDGLLSMEQAITGGVQTNVQKAVTQGAKGFMGDNTGDRLKDKYGVMQ